MSSSSQKLLKQVFTVVDTDSSGEATEAEFGAFFGVLAMNVISQDTAVQFEAFLKGIGALAAELNVKEISMQQFVEFDFGKYIPDDWEEGVEDILRRGTTIYALMQLFDVIDADNSGAISEKEMGAFFKALMDGVETKKERTACESFMGAVAELAKGLDDQKKGATKKEFVNFDWSENMDEESADDFFEITMEILSNKQAISAALTQKKKVYVL